MIDERILAGVDFPLGFVGLGIHPLATSLLSIHEIPNSCSQRFCAMARNDAIASTLASYVQTHMVAAGHGSIRRGDGE